MFLKRCPHPDCHELIPVGSKDCGNHAEVVKVCLGGCGAVMTGKRLRCEPCRKIFANDQRRGQCKANPDYIARPPEPEPPPPKEKAVYTPPSDYEQRLLDKEVHAKLNKRCGYTKDEGKVYTASEIAAIAHQITPISRIQHKDMVTGWNW